MGTVLEKANKIKETKNKLKEAINNGGGQITDDTIFNDYANEIKDIYIDAISNGVDNIYNNFPKVIGKGSEITLNTEEAPINITLEGNTSQKTSVLPEEYTQVNYIESSGTQYIDTGFKPNQDTKVDIKLYSLRTNTYFNAPFGARVGNTNQFFIGLQTNQQNNNWFLRYGTLESVGAYGIKYGYNHVLFDKNTIYFNDELAYSFTEQTFQNTYNMYLFACNIDGTADRHFYGYIYSCQIYDNNVLIRNFIPCYRNSDNEVGMYDLVTDTFYTNQGTGVFTYGSVATIPNPDYPQDIKVVTGEQNINMRSKNLFDYTKHNALTLDSNGRITTTEYVNQDNTVIYKLKPNTKYTFSFRNSNMGLSNYGLSMTLNGTWVQTNSGKYTVTSDSNGEFAIKIGAQSYPNIGAASAYIQLEEGTSVTSYTPYQLQAYPISLGDIELCKINDYKDYIFKNVVGSPYYNDNLELNEWYLHKEIGEENIDVSTITLKSDYSNIEYAIIPKANDYIGYNEWGNKPVIYTHALFNNNPSNWNRSSNVNKIYSGSERIYWWLGFTKGTGLVNIKSQLENSIIYYPLKNPTNTKITDTTLISQLENINNNAHSYSGTTIIECSSVNDNNEAMQVSTIALKDINLIESEWEE